MSWYHQFYAFIDYMRGQRFTTTIIINRDVLLVVGRFGAEAYGLFAGPYNDNGVEK